MSFWNDLIVRIKGDSADLDQTLDQSQTKIQKFATGMGKWFKAGAVAVVAALGTIALAMKSTEGSADKLEAVVASLRGGYQGFIETALSGDWGNLIDNITKTAKATRDLAIARDELKDIEASNEVKKGLIEREIAAARLAAAGVTDPTLKAQYLQQAIDAQKRLTALEVSEVEHRLEATEGFFKTKMGFDDATTKRVIENFRKIAGEEADIYGEMGRLQNFYLQQDALQAKQELTGLTNLEQQTLHNVNAQIAYMELYQEMRNSMKPEEFNAYVKEVGLLNSTLAEGDVALRRITQSLTTTEEKLNSGAGAYNEYKTALDKINMDLNKPKSPPTADSNLGYFGYGQFMLKTGRMGSSPEQQQKQEQLLEYERQFNKQLHDVMQEGVMIAAQSIEDLFGAMASGDWGSFGESLLMGVANFLSTLGKLLISFAIAESGFMQAIKNPAAWPVALAAGVAAIAIAGLIRGAISGGQQAITSGSSGASSSADVNLQNLKVIVEGKIQGRDIYISNRRYSDELNRST